MVRWFGGSVVRWFGGSVVSLTPMNNMCTCRGQPCKTCWGAKPRCHFWSVLYFSCNQHFTCRRQPCKTCWGAKPRCHFWSVLLSLLNRRPPRSKKSESAKTCNRYSKISKTKNLRKVRSEKNSSLKFGRFNTIAKKIGVRKSESKILCCKQSFLRYRLSIFEPSFTFSP